MIDTQNREFEAADHRRFNEKVERRFTSSLSWDVTLFLADWRLKPPDDPHIYVSVRIALYQVLKAADEGREANVEVAVYETLAKSWILSGKSGSASDLPNVTWLNDQDDRGVVRAAYSVLDQVDRFLFFLWHSARLSAANIATILNGCVGAEVIDPSVVESHLRDCWASVTQQIHAGKPQFQPASGGKKRGGP